MKRGISPVIATVILVAVTLAIAVAIVGWLFGLWGGLAGGTPQISIPLGEIVNITETTDNTTTTLTVVRLYVKNDGAGSDKILKIEAIYRGEIYKCTKVKNEKATEEVIVGASSWDNAEGATIKGNAVGWIYIAGCNFTVNAGDNVVIKLYLEKSGVIPITIQAKVTGSISKPSG